MPESWQLFLFRNKYEESFLEAMKIFERAGWNVDRRAKSGYIIMKKTSKKTTLSVPSQILDRGSYDL